MNKLLALLFIPAISQASWPTFRAFDTFDAHGYIESIGPDGVVIRTRTTSNIEIATMPPQREPDQLFEETWACDGSKLVLKKKRTGHVVEVKTAEHEEWDK